MPNTNYPIRQLALLLHSRESSFRNLHCSQFLFPPVVDFSLLLERKLADYAVSERPAWIFAANQIV
jgi:hypothetical protein